MFLALSWPTLWHRTTYDNSFKDSNKYSNRPFLYRTETLRLPFMSSNTLCFLWKLKNQNFSAYKYYQNLSCTPQQHSLIEIASKDECKYLKEHFNTTLGVLKYL